MRMSIVGFDGTFWGVILVRWKFIKKKKKISFAVFVCQETTRTTKKRNEKKI